MAPAAWEGAATRGGITVRVRDIDDRDRLYRELTELARRNRLSERGLAQLKVVLDELLTNIFSYGCNGDAVPRVEVRLEAVGAFLEIEVVDDGRPFDPLQPPEPETDLPLDERPIGGLGVYLMRKLTDELEYRRQWGRNRLVLRKRLAADADADHPEGAAGR